MSQIYSGERPKGPSTATARDASHRIRRTGFEPRKALERARLIFCRHSQTANNPRRLPTRSTLFAFLHHLAAFTLVSALAVEFVLIRQELTLANARKLPVVDAVLGGSAGMLLIVGLLRVFYFEKGSAYYFSSHAFLTKFAVFIILAILSIVPTMEFLSWRRALKAGQVPAVDARKMRLVRSLIHGELAGIVIILLCAAIMARGGWR